MVVWVKELEGILHLKDIESWIKKDVLVKPYKTIEDIADEDIIIISKNDSEEFTEEKSILVDEDILRKITLNVFEEVRDNYDFYFLQNAIDSGTRNAIDTVIVGNSYGLFDIEESLLSNEVNCSLPYQDNYYSAKNIYKIWERNKGIKNIVLCCGYNFFHADLSRTQNLTEINQVSKVYKPLYNDCHNCILLPAKENLIMKSEIFDIEKILKMYSKSEYDKHYFHENMERKLSATRAWNDLSKDLIDLSEEEKWAAGEVRAQVHNGGLCRSLSYRQNTRIFMNLASFCLENEINLVVVVTPVTKYYRKFFSDDYKGMFYDLLEKADCPIHVLDFFDDESFEDTDFNDLDHLGDSGAYKFTKSLLNFLSEF